MRYSRTHHTPSLSAADSVLRSKPKSRLKPIAKFCDPMGTNRTNPTERYSGMTSNVPTHVLTNMCLIRVGAY